MATLKPLPEDEEKRVEIALKLLDAVQRCRELGWRTVTVNRLVRIANGDPMAFPPDPATAPDYRRGTYHS